MSVNPYCRNGIKICRRYFTNEDVNADGVVSYQRNDFSHIFDRLDERLRRVPQRVSLLWIYWQPVSCAACCVLSYEDASLERLLSWWATSLKEMYPSANVMQTAFQIADIPVHQFMINTREVVHIKLICEISRSPVFAVDYLIPKGVYARELRSIESSIGSIQIVNNE